MHFSPVKKSFPCVFEVLKLVQEDGRQPKPGRTTAIRRIAFIQGTQENNGYTAGRGQEQRLYGRSASIATGRGQREDTLSVDA